MLGKNFMPNIIPSSTPSSLARAPRTEQPMSPETLIMYNILQWRPPLVMDYAWRLQNVSKVDSTSLKSCLCSPVVSRMRGLHRCKRCSFSQPEGRKEVICSEDHPVEGGGS
ncbi:unnamed protein product [Boreogadus saida]